MSDRHRALPSWMAKGGEKVKEKKPLKSRRKPKVTRAVFYCMNEKELLDAAVSFLTDCSCEDVAPLTDHKVEGNARDKSVKIREKSASTETRTKPLIQDSEDESTDCSDALESTYVSETDLDVTEVETLPYTSNAEQQGPEAQPLEPVQDQSGLMDVEKREERSRTPTGAAEDDDSMRLVREIFFT